MWEPTTVAHVIASYFSRLGQDCADDVPVNFTAERLPLHVQLAASEKRSAFTAFLPQLTRVLPAPEVGSHLEEQMHFFLKQAFLKAFIASQPALSDAQAVRDSLQGSLNQHSR